MICQPYFYGVNLGSQTAVRKMTKGPGPKDSLVTNWWRTPSQVPTSLSCLCGLVQRRMELVSGKTATTIGTSPSPQHIGLPLKSESEAEARQESKCLSEHFHVTLVSGMEREAVTKLVSRNEAVHSRRVKRGCDLVSGLNVLQVFFRSSAVRTLPSLSHQQHQHGCKPERRRAMCGSATGEQGAGS